MGEGGGQVLRTALALAMCCQQAVHIINIRAKRNKPGLMRQHLTAVQAATHICNGQTQGAAIGSQEVMFCPGEVQAGVYTFSVGTAGSTSLVFQTVLPALMLATGPSVLNLEGGTHNPFAPPFDFIQLAFLPVLQRMGVACEAHLERFGFYPAGGGRWSVSIQSASQLQALQLIERGALLEYEAVAVSAGIPGHVAERELRTVGRLLDWPEDCLKHQRLAKESGPGNCLNLILRCENVTEVFTEFGQVGVRAEKVAQRCVQRVQRYLAAPVAVAENLADQLLLPLALAGGGVFTSLAPTQHTTTHIEVIQHFLPVRLVTEQVGEDAWRFQVRDESKSVLA
jgi:RNA 3'-terminal phosphate cyclase (ATP)